MKRLQHQSWLVNLGSYLLVPHELLHIVGFRLVGKRCEYQWGNPHVTPIGPMSRLQRLVGRLFPFGVFSTVVIVSGILAGFAYGQALRGGSFFWFVFWLVLAHIAGLYAGTTIGDLRRAYLLIFDKPWYGWTPFDIFYWPVVDWEKVRQDITLGQDDDKS